MHEKKIPAQHFSFDLGSLSILGVGGEKFDFFYSLHGGGGGGGSCREGLGGGGGGVHRLGGGGGLPLRPPPPWINP